MYPAPIRWLMHGVLTAGRGALFTRTVFFLGGKPPGARIMRAPARSGCGHTSRTKRSPATRGRDPGSVHRFGLGGSPGAPETFGEGKAQLVEQLPRLGHDFRKIVFHSFTSLLVPTFGGVAAVAS